MNALSIIVDNKTKQYKQIKKAVDKALTHAIEKPINPDRMSDKHYANVRKGITMEMFSYEKVSTIIADHYDVDVSLLPEPTKKREVVDARQEVMFIMYAAKVGYSQKQIGVYLGARDHSTIYHSCLKVNHRVDTIMGYRKRMAELFLCFDPKFNFKKKKLGYLLKE